ncbi:MAG: RcnB family protein [Sphingopyxis sp.]
MKSQFLIGTIIASMLLPAAAATAQTRELRNDRQEVREEQRELNRARAAGTPAQVREERRERNDAVRELNQDQRAHQRQRAAQRDHAQTPHRAPAATRAATWQEHRRTHRSAYHAARFTAPFRYRAVRAGSVLSADIWARPYRVANVSRWPIPAAGRGQIYVRHYNDLILVNNRNGHVIRVYRNFYW